MIRSWWYGIGGDGEKSNEKREKENIDHWEIFCLDNEDNLRSKKFENVDVALSFHQL